MTKWLPPHRPAGIRLAFLVFLMALLAAACGGGGGDGDAVEPAAAAGGDEVPTADDGSGSTAADDGAAGSDGGDTVRIGLIEPLTGPAAYYGQRIKQGVDLAAAKINEEGGIAGAQVEIVAEDNQTDNAQTVSLFRQMAAQEDIVTVIGPTHSANYLAGAPLAEQLQVVWFSAGSGAPWGEGLPSAWTFRNTVPFVEMAPQAVEEIVAPMDVDSVGTIYSPDNPGVESLVGLAEEPLAELGLEQAPAVQAATATTDFGPQITQLLQDPPEVLIINLVTEDAALFMRQARERGLESRFIAVNNGLLDFQILELSQGAAEGLIVPSHFDPDSGRPETEEFLQAWEEEHGDLDDFLVTYGYDAVYILKQAIEDAGSTTDRDAVREALGQISDLCLSSGCYSYDGPGDRLESDVYPVQMTAEGAFRRWTP